MNKNNKFFKIKFMGSNYTKNRTVASEFETLLEGRVIKVAPGDEWKLFTKEMKDIYEDYQRKSNGSLYLKWDFKTKKVQIFASVEHSLKLCESKINQALFNFEQRSIKQDLKIHEYNIHSVAKQVQKYEEQQFLNLNIKLDIMRKSLQFEGSKQAIDKFIQEIEGFKLKFTKNGDNNCLTCFCDLGTDYHLLLYCRHKICRDCSINYIRSELNSSIPKLETVCPIDGCEIAYKDLRVVSSGKDMEELIKRHIDRFILEQKFLYRYCDTANCNNILIINKDQTADCPKCLRSFCFKIPNKPHKAHPEKTCSEFFEDSDGDKKIQALLDKGDLRIAPCCQNLMVKTSGCDHITCHCNKHWCYACLDLFEVWNYSHFNVCTKKPKAQRYIKKTAEIDEFSKLIQNGSIRILQCCKIPIERTEGCNHMTCVQCKRHSCYQCLDVFDDYEKYDHHQAYCKHALSKDYLEKNLTYA